MQFERIELKNLVQSAFAGEDNEWNLQFTKSLSIKIKRLSPKLKFLDFLRKRNENAMDTPNHC